MIFRFYKTIAKYTYRYNIPQEVVLGMFWFGVYNPVRRRAASNQTNVLLYIENFLTPEAG